MRKSRDRVQRAIKALEPFKRRVYEEKWNTHFVCSASCAAGEHSCIFTREKPASRLADLKGLKIRAPGGRPADVVNGMGASAQFMKLSEVYMALKTGVVDGAFTSPAAVAPEKLYEVLDYCLDIVTTEAITADVRVNLDAWNALPDELKDLVTAVMTNTYGRRSLDEAQNMALIEHNIRECKQGGMTFTELPPEDWDAVMEIGLKLHLDWVEKSTPLTKEAWSIIEPIVLGD